MRRIASTGAILALIACGGDASAPADAVSVTDSAGPTPFRHRQHRHGRLVRGNDARFQDARAVWMREHLQPPRIVRIPQWRGDAERTRRRDQPSVCARQAVGQPGAIRFAVVPGVRVPVSKPHGSIPREWFEGSAPCAPSSRPVRVRPPTEPPSTVRHFTPPASERESKPCGGRSSGRHFRAKPCGGRSSGSVSGSAGRTPGQGV